LSGDRAARTVFAQVLEDNARFGGFDLVDRFGRFFGRLGQGHFLGRQDDGRALHDGRGLFDHRLDDDRGFAVEEDALLLVELLEGRRVEQGQLDLLLGRPLRTSTRW